MATIKSYSDLQQSKKLAQILPIESADMFYKAGNDTQPTFRLHSYGHIMSDKDVCAWSLAALLSVLPNSIYDNTNEFSQLEFSKKSVAYHDMNDEIKIGILKDNPVDACVEMILKLHELKLL